ncbi:MAG: anaerobic ribonucleoside-triphosphate reductase activating protein [Deferribacteres bacterium]|nr:anaerobic ribonucleoside-triphosphate reductase activating protein [Deferribacteres bacterium]
MKTGGLHKLSLIDYPGKISAVVFTQGCNFRCPYCHNPGLVYPHLFSSPVPEHDILSFLSRRQGLIDGVVITGGEPLLQPGLEDFIRRVRDMGFSVKLDTNASNPARLEGLLKAGLIDYVAVDYKAPLRMYHMAAGTAVDTGDIVRSVTAVTGSGIPYEVRTTLFSGLGSDDITEMAEELHMMKAENYFLQAFRPYADCGEDLAPREINLGRLYETLCGFSSYGIRNITKEEQCHYVCYR